MSVVLPEPQSPKIPIANRGLLWRMTSENALAVVVKAQGRRVRRLV
jgi:hypothetical protein